MVAHRHAIRRALYILLHPARALGAHHGTSIRPQVIVAGPHAPTDHGPGPISSGHPPSTRMPVLSASDGRRRDDHPLEGR